MMLKPALGIDNGTPLAAVAWKARPPTVLLNVEPRARHLKLLALVANRRGERPNYHPAPETEPNQENHAKYVKHSQYDQ